MEQALNGDLDWHAAMLLDDVRVNWFARAIAASVRPGDTVLDLGSGTGLMALLAARAGARRVYAIERSPIANLAVELVEANGLADQVLVVPGNAFDVTLPEKVDVIISETLGAWGVDEGIAAIMADAAARLALPEARMVPSELTLWAAPAMRADQLTPPHLRALGLNYDCFFQRLGSSPSRGAQAEVKPSRLLAPAQQVLSIVLGRDVPDRLRVSADFALPDDSGCDALVGWFTAHSPGVDPLSTGPTDPPTMWGQIVVPLAAVISGRTRVQFDFTFGAEGIEVDLAAIPIG